MGFVEFLEMLNPDQLAGLLTGGILALTALGFVASFVMNILRVVGQWKLFNKFGESGWKCLIPFYNIWVEYGYTWKAIMSVPSWILSLAGSLIAKFASEEYVALLLLAEVMMLTGWIITCIGYGKLCRSFGHGGFYTVGMILFPGIFTIVLGLGKSQYTGHTSGSVVETKK